MKISVDELKNVKGIGDKTLRRVRNYLSKGEKTFEPKIPFPNKKYDVIYADPPWEPIDSGSGVRGTADLDKRYKGTMSVLELKTLPIKRISKQNCLLFCWVTFPRLIEGLTVIRSWGFEYHSLGFNWVKKNKSSDSWFWGMGYYTRQNPEVCLIGRKGKFLPKSRGVHSVLDAPIDEHSRKPEEARARIEQICGEDCDKIELFARERADGWDVWGNEV